VNPLSDCQGAPTRTTRLSPRASSPPSPRTPLHRRGAGAKLGSVAAELGRSGLPLGLGNHRGLVAPGELLNLGDLVGEGNQLGQGGLGVLVVLGHIGFVAFYVEPQGGPRGARARQAEDDPGSIGEANPHPLLGRHAAIDGVGVGEVVGVIDGVGAVGFAGEGAEGLA